MTELGSFFCLFLEFLQETHIREVHAFVLPEIKQVNDNRYTNSQ